METVKQIFIELIVFFIQIILLNTTYKYTGTVYTIVTAIYIYDYYYIGTMRNTTNKTVSDAIYWITILVIPVTFHAIKTFS